MGQPAKRDFRLVFYVHGPLIALSSWSSRVNTRRNAPAGDRPGQFRGSPSDTRLAGNTLVTSVSQIVTMGLGAILAFVVVFAFGKTDKTDGFFTAYGVYGVLVIVAQSLRTTLLARLVEAPSLWPSSIGTSRPSSPSRWPRPCRSWSSAPGRPRAHRRGLRRRPRRRAHRAVAVRPRGRRPTRGRARRRRPRRVDRFVAVAVAYVAAGVTSIVAVLALAGPST